MKYMRLISFAAFTLIITGCAPIDEIYSHDFSTGRYKLREAGGKESVVYISKNEDSLTVFNLTHTGKVLPDDLKNGNSFKVTDVNPDCEFYNSTFIRTTGDIDLSTVLLKYRPSAGGVPAQLSANVNGVFYAGFRKDYFKIKLNRLSLMKPETFLRHTGFDFGPFIGIGITPLNATVTDNKNIQEYDGIVLQKGFGIFVTYESMSVGFSIGFDNLLNENRNIWVFNNKPWFGLVLGIANF